MTSKATIADIKDVVSGVLRECVSQQNELATREKITETVERYMDRLLRTGVVYDYAIACGKSAHTPNETHLDVCVKIREGDEFIHLPFSVTADNGLEKCYDNSHWSLDD